jgi:hypothetical protein
VDDPDALPISPTEQARLDALGRALEEAAKDLRDGKVDPQLLKDLGMTQEQFKNFVEEYTQKFGQVKEMLAQTQRPTESVQTGVQTPGDDKLSTGNTVDGQMGVSGTDKLAPDDIRKLNEAKATKVSPEYRREVEAFFKALSENAGSTVPKNEKK